MNVSVESKTGLPTKGNAPVQPVDRGRSEARTTDSGKYVARLESQFPMERYVQFFGASGEQMAVLCRKYLDERGRPGDVFVLYEIVERECGRFVNADPS